MMSKAKDIESKNVGNSSSDSKDENDYTSGKLFQF